MDETTIYEQGTVKITNLRAILGPKTYSVSNLTSVTLASKAPEGCFPVALWGTGGLFAAFGGILLIAAIVERADFGLPLVLLAVGVVGVTLGVVIQRGQKTTYLVRVGSASGESNDMQSTDRASIQEIVDALNEAIVRKG
jgi:hypothetical protein